MEETEGHDEPLAVTDVPKTAPSSTPVVNGKDISPEQPDAPVLNKEAAAQPKKKILVIDTAAFIKGVRLERLAEEFWTIREVLDEVRDKKARDFLQTLPFEIKCTEPAAQDVQKGLPQRPILNPPFI